MTTEKRLSLGVAVIWLAIGACASDDMGTRAEKSGSHNPGQGSPLPHISQEEFTVVSADGDAEAVLSQIGIVSNVPAEVSVMTVTSAVLQGVNMVSGCVVGTMGSDGVALRKGDQLALTWMPQDLTALTDGVYNQQTTIQGNIPYYEADGYAHPARSEAFLAWDYRPFEVRSGTLRLISAEEYGAAQPGGHDDDPAVIEAGGEHTAPDLAPTDCDPSDVAVTIHVTPALAP